MWVNEWKKKNMENSLNNILQNQQTVISRYGILFLSFFCCYLMRGWRQLQEMPRQGWKSIFCVCFFFVGKKEEEEATKKILSMLQRWMIGCGERKTFESKVILFSSHCKLCFSFIYILTFVFVCVCACGDGCIGQKVLNLIKN